VFPVWAEIIGQSQAHRRLNTCGILGMTPESKSISRYVGLRMGLQDLRDVWRI
jgi:hypothetical protein